MATFRIAEIFFSLQGESTKAGWLSGFIRLYGCNLDCSYCDTSYAVKGNEYYELTIDEILERISLNPTRLLEITGGEPLIAENVDLLIDSLIKTGYDLMIETNGTVDISRFNRSASYIVDYKLAYANPEIKFNEANFFAISKKDEMKFVIADKNDFYEALEIVKKHDLVKKTNLNFSAVWNLFDYKELVDLMIAEKLDARVNLPYHKIIYKEDARGR